MKLIFIFFIGFILISCKANNNKGNNNITNDLIIKKSNKNNEFDFNSFKIQKGKLGSIKIGMTIAKAEKQFSGLTKITDEATSLGIGGGSPAYLYYSGDEILFSLIPKLDTDTLLFILAFNKNLRTTNGLNPNSTIEELQKEYPNMLVQKDLMNDWEKFNDENNGWTFVFMTDENKLIGEYQDLETPSKPKRLETKANWIIIE